MLNNCLETHITHQRKYNQKLNVLVLIIQDRRRRIYTNMYRTPKVISEKLQWFHRSQRNFA